MMAVDLHSRDSLLLPPLQSQFVTEEKNDNEKPSKKNLSCCFSSSDFGSVFSSPVESEQSSTESESDQDDDYIGELTRQMAHYMLQDDENRQEMEAWSKAVPLQSTEWPKLGSSKQEEVAMKGKYENLNMNEKKLGYPLTTRKPTSPNLEFHSRQALIDQQIRAIQLVKQQQESSYWAKQANGYKQQRQFHRSKGRACNGFGNGQKGSWANLQQQHRTGSEMTAVFLGEADSRSGSCGTGVFLPRGITNPYESRKRPGCSTVLVPARVIQALKHHFDKMGIESRSISATFPIQNDAITGNLRYGQLQIQKNSKTQTQTVPPMNHQEMGLPQEWTY